MSLISWIGKVSIGENSIGDERFWEQLAQIRELKRFLFEQNVVIRQDDLPRINLAHLDGLRFHRLARAPTADEWAMLDEKLSVLSVYLDHRLRWRLQLREMRIFFSTLPIYLLFFAVLALGLEQSRAIFASVLPQMVGDCLYSTATILWILALGGLGACAFLGTTMISESARLNILSTEKAADAKVGSEFDLTDRNLIGVRIVVGILFAFLLGLPLSAGSLTFMVTQLQTGSIKDVNLDADLMKTISLSLLPFVVGFSTTLVLGIMDRFISAIRTIFGIVTK